ncbi:hypothetical protein [Agrobacterium tumefaciens]|uniref:hypothetical protein n=1 Tax=Agrobacterium tumefaciens TaxID=358 RepID=UPI00287C31E3|nr:hypothetical protein [Agrobacterium tumefaciens]MDS7594128.1 hypothetical protein [Agrobacterium tumefaciens]
MITPLQQTAGIAVGDLMRSMIETIEERQREEQEKANGTKHDETVKAAQPQPDQSQRAANEKISAYLFGAMRPDPDAFASLVARFSSALGVTQGNDETNAAFAQRLQDALTLTDNFEKTDYQGNPTKISLKSLGVSEAQVIDVMNGAVTSWTDPMASLAARIAKNAGLTGQEEDFGEQMTKAIMAARASLPKSVNDLEESTGIKELGISAEQMISAIANPWSETARAVKEALNEQAQSGGMTTRETLKVIQRLEDVADPKTKEELQAERDDNRIGEVNDAEVSAEREADIRNFDAKGKLEDVQKLQDAVKEHIDASKDAGSDDAQEAGPLDIDSEMAMISAPSSVTTGSVQASPTDEAEDNQPAEIRSSTEADDVNDAEKLLDAQTVVEEGQKHILPISIDENGLYELLRKKAA